MVFLHFSSRHCAIYFCILIKPPFNSLSFFLWCVFCFATVTDLLIGASETVIKGFIETLETVCPHAIGAGNHKLAGQVSIKTWKPSIKFFHMNSNLPIYEF